MSAERVRKRCRRMLAVLFLVMVAGEGLPTTILNPNCKIALFAGFEMGWLMSVVYLVGWRSAPVAEQEKPRG